MGKPRMTALAVALRAIEPLSNEEKQTVRDMLRPAPKPRSKSKSERKQSQKRKAGKEAEGVIVGNCAKPGCGKSVDENVHQLTNLYGYHEFQPADEAKGAGV